MPSNKTQLEVILKTTADLITHYRGIDSVINNICKAYSKGVNKIQG